MRMKQELVSGEASIAPGRYCAIGRAMPAADEFVPHAEMDKHRIDLWRHGLADARLTRPRRIDQPDPQLRREGRERQRRGASGRPAAGDQDIEIRHDLQESSANLGASAGPYSIE